MIPTLRLAFPFAVITVAVGLLSVPMGGQIHGQAGGQTGEPGIPEQAAPPSRSVSNVPSNPVMAKSMPGAPGTTGGSGAPGGGRRSMLDEPAAAAKVTVSGDTLSISANNASLSELIRQVAAQTGMQVEGNSRDERVFGSYGPGNPPDVLSSLLYDSGYNVIMVGSTVDGAPRRLVLSTRSASAAAPMVAAAPPRNNDDDEEQPDQPVEAAQPPPTPASGATPGSPAPGQPKSPQQMLEELQRMHQGQQPQDVPKDPQQ